MRPPSPVAEGSFNYPNAYAVPQMHGMPAGMGVSTNKFSSIEAYAALAVFIF